MSRLSNGRQSSLGERGRERRRERGRERRREKAMEWGDMVRCGEIAVDVGRCGEMWGDGPPEVRETAEEEPQRELPVAPRE